MSSTDLFVYILICLLPDLLGATSQSTRVFDINVEPLVCVPAVVEPSWTDIRAKSTFKECLKAALRSETMYFGISTDRASLQCFTGMLLDYFMRN